MKTVLLRTLWVVASLIGLVGCATIEDRYHSTNAEPNDLPPSDRYAAVLLALKDELRNHRDVKEFYLCQSPGQVAALQHDIPEFTLKHASETYARPVDGWPFIALCHRLSDDSVVTRVVIDIESATKARISTKIYIGSQYPNMQECFHTMTKSNGIWMITSRHRPLRIQI